MAQRRSGLARLSAGSKGLLISGILLFAFLFLPWQTVVRIEPFLGIEGRDVNDTAFGSGLGILVAVLLIAVLAWEGVLAAGVKVGTGTSPALISALAGGVVALLTIVLFLSSLGSLAWGAFLGLVAGVAMAYAAYVRYQESRTKAPPGT